MKKRRIRVKDLDEEELIFNFQMDRSPKGDFMGSFWALGGEYPFIEIWLGAMGEECEESVFEYNKDLLCSIISHEYLHYCFFQIEDETGEVINEAEGVEEAIETVTKSILEKWDIWNGKKGGKSNGTNKRGNSSTN